VSLLLDAECMRGPGFESLRYSTVQNDLWSLGIILTNLLIGGGNLWYTASLEDERFAHYVKDPRGFLKKRCPLISEDAINILLGVLNINLLARTPIAVLREEVKEVKTFFGAKHSFLDREEQETSLSINIDVPDHLDKLLEMQLKFDIEVEVRVDVEVEVKIEDEPNRDLQAENEEADEEQWSYWISFLDSPEMSSTPSYSSSVSFVSVPLESSERLDEVQFEADLEAGLIFVMESQARKDVDLEYLDMDLADSENLKGLLL
jgi:hypothetical protein